MNNFEEGGVFSISGKPATITEISGRDVSYLYCGNVVTHSIELFWELTR